MPSIAGQSFYDVLTKAEISIDPTNSLPMFSGWMFQLFERDYIYTQLNTYGRSRDLSANHVFKMCAPQ